MNKKLALAVIWLCFAPSILIAQSLISISARVQDSLGHPIEAATAALHSLPDSTLVKTALTDSTGTFLLDGLKEGTYFLELFSIEYKIYRGQPVVLHKEPPAVQLPPIVLQSSSNGLAEVQVMARKAFVVHKADRTIVNVDALISAAGTTALDVLQKSPGVQVDQDGNITMRGKQGVAIYINDKLTYLSGNDLAAYLRSLPASSLDQIELMTNPPANYDAAGNAGVINIKTKQAQKDGFNGGINLSGTQGKRTRSSNSVNLNYRNKKISTYINADYTYINMYSDLDLNRTYNDANNSPNTYFEQNTYFRGDGHAVSVAAGADYYQSETSTIGIVLTGMAHQYTRMNDNTSHVLNAARQPDSTIIAHNADENHSQNGSINLNYRKKFDKNGHGFSANADYITYHTQSFQSYQNKYINPANPLIREDELNGTLPDHIDIYSLKADYTRPNVFKWTLSTGAKASFAQTDNLADYSNTAANVTTPDYDKSNHFLYHENITAAYVNANRDIGRLSVQGGLRLENTVSIGHQLGNIQKSDSSFNRNYTSLFPTVYLNYKFDSAATHQVGINYGRRVNRPYYQDLNPFVSPMDKFTYYTGNPFLKPAFAQSIEVSHTYKNKITTIFTFSKTKDDVNETIEIQNGIYYSRPGNIGSKEIKTLAVDGTFDPAKWLNIHAYTELGNIASRSALYTGTLNSSGTYWFINTDLRITPAKGWDIEVSGRYRTKIYDAQFVISDIWQASVAVQRKLSAKATLKLSGNDLFLGEVVHGVINNLDHATASWINRRDSRNVILSFSYRFGKTEGAREKYDANGADAEKSRVKG